MTRARDRYDYGPRSPRREGGLLRLFDLIVFALTVVAALLLLCAYLSRYINPNTAWVFAFAGLAAPILYVVNMVLALYWVIRWKRFALVPVAVLLVGAGWISLFFRPTLSKERNHENVRRATTVMSYNVAGFLAETNGRRNTSSLDSVTAFIGRMNPDILCIQEFQCNRADRKPHIDSLLGLPYNKVNYKVPNTEGGGWGLAVYSRHRIINSGVVDFERTTNSALWADLLVRNDTVRVFNCHLQTTSVDMSDREYIMGQEFVADNTREDRVRSIAGKLRRNFMIRATQVDSLAPMIHASPYKVIVCGDFNDTPMSYAYRTMRGPLADAFVEKGTGIPSTYQGLFNLFRIDYIFHSRSIPTVSYISPPGEYSDHKAVIATLGL